jgi:membrane associated rhomboid family serine protease
MKHIEKAKLLTSLFYPALFVAIIWVVKLLEIILDTRFSALGIMPQKLSGLVGVIAAPLLHEDLAHLTANSLPALVLGSMLFYAYRPIAWRIIILIYLSTGFWVWVFGRESYHIGASGVVYGLASFLFFSGIFRKDSRLLAITFLVAFLYGSMVWGVFPELFPEKNISWESHLMGLVAGLVFAFYYKSEGPPQKKYSWELEEEDDADADDPDAYWNIKPKSNQKTRFSSSGDYTQINYVYKNTEKSQQEPEQPKRPDIIA